MLNLIKNSSIKITKAKRPEEPKELLPSVIKMPYLKKISIKYIVKNGGWLMRSP
jgi:hypothetical protein